MSVYKPVNRKIESCVLKPQRWLLIHYSNGIEFTHEERKASHAEEFLCYALSESNERTRQLDAALRRLINHWREFGPEGFEELIESRTLTARDPDMEKS